MKTQSGESRDNRDVFVLGELCFQNVFRRHENENTVCSFHLKSVFETELWFRDGLVWTVGLSLDSKPPLYFFFTRTDSGNYLNKCHW